MKKQNVNSDILLIQSENKSYKKNTLLINFYNKIIMTEKHKNNNRMLNNSITWHMKKSNKIKKKK